MKKNELLKAIKEKAGAKNVNEVDVILKATEEVIKDTLALGDEITVCGVRFGTKVQKGREGVSPFNNKPYKTDDKTVPTVKATKALKDAVL